MAFFVTVALCSFLLVFSFAFTQPFEIIVSTQPVLAMPRPPEPLELAAAPESVVAEFESAWALPELDMAWDSLEQEGTWALPQFDMAWASTQQETAWDLPEAGVTTAGVETISMIPSEPKRPTAHEHIPFHGIIVQVAGRYEVDPHLIRAIIFAESGFNPKAKSKKGARGLMQLMPSTAKSLGVQDIYDPEENIDGGVRYFRSLLDRFEGDVQLALAAYNAGSRHVRNYEGVPPFRATRLYIKKVLKFHKKFKAEMAARNARLA